MLPKKKMPPKEMPKKKMPPKGVGKAVKKSPGKSKGGRGGY